MLKLDFHLVFLGLNFHPNFTMMIEGMRDRKKTAKSPLHRYLHHYFFFSGHLEIEKLLLKPIDIHLDLIDRLNTSDMRIL